MKRGLGIVVGLCSVGSMGCAPVFSELQSAKLVGKRHVEVTPSFTSVSFSDDHGSDHVQNEYGVQAATGVHDNVDMRLRYVRVSGVNVLGAGPKFRLVTDKVALYVPIGFAFGAGVHSSKSWQVHPTLLLTAPVNRHFEVDGSVKYLVPISDSDADKTVAFNLGVALGPGDVERWAIRPEIGFLFDPGEKGHYTQFSLGLSFRPH